MADDTADQDKQALLVLHGRVLLGHAEARDAIARILFARGRRIVRLKIHQVDRDVIDQAVIDAVMWYLAHPGRYDRSRSNLLSFISHSAMQNVIDHVRRERSRIRYEDTAGRAAEIVLSPEDPLIPSEWVDKRRLLLKAARSLEDGHFIAAWLDGARTSILANIIHASQLTPDDQKKVVNRVKERIRLRLKRACLASRRARV